MPQIATFVYTKDARFPMTIKALIADGWTKIPYTTGNRRIILMKYYEYLVNTNAKLAGINPSLLTPAQLAPVWENANTEYVNYEMYVKNTAVVANDMDMDVSDSPPVFEEIFASVNNIQRMQPGYVDIDDLLAGFGRIGFGGGKRRKHSMKHRKMKSYTKKNRRTKHHKSRRNYKK